MVARGGMSDMIIEGAACTRSSVFYYLGTVGK